MDNTKVIKTIFEKNEMKIKEWIEQDKQNRIFWEELQRIQDKKEYEEWKKNKMK